MNENKIPCLECGKAVKDYLGDHLLSEHGMSLDAYLQKYPKATMTSTRLDQLYQKHTRSAHREHPPDPSNLTVKFSEIEYPVNSGVPEEACLKFPDHYVLPTKGDLGKDVQHAAICLAKKRSTYIWGLPGTGKDAFYHAWSALTRTPALLKQIKPGVDLEAWFFSRGFNQSGAIWEEGEFLKALRDGYVTDEGERIPYLIVLSDFDRADREQAENMRLITDSIQGRIEGPAGIIYEVLPGTIIVATANTSGGGDERGRMISANPIDASLLDRFQAKFQFRWMDWVEEEVVCRKKFPLLVEKCPKIFEVMGVVTNVIRDAVLRENLHAEFSHRAVCSVLEHASDTIECNKKVPKKIYQLALRAWLDGLPDRTTREEAVKMIDPLIKDGALEQGDTSGIGAPDSLLPREA